MAVMSARRRNEWEAEQAEAKRQKDAYEASVMTKYGPLLTEANIGRHGYASAKSKLCAGGDNHPWPKVDIIAYNTNRKPEFLKSDYVTRLPRLGVVISNMLTAAFGPNVNDLYVSSGLPKDSDDLPALVEEKSYKFGCVWERLYRSASGTTFNGCDSMEVRIFTPYPANVGSGGCMDQFQILFELMEDSDGRVSDVEGMRLRIERCGIAPKKAA